jgi:hypothetical protein
MGGATGSVVCRSLAVLRARACRPQARALARQQQQQQQQQRAALRLLYNRQI